MRVPAEDIVRWRQANGLSTGSAAALAPGSVGVSKRWTYYPEAARLLAERGLEVWVVGGPAEKGLAPEIVAAGGPRVRDLTGTDLRNGVLAMAAAGVAISNDSGLMHIAAALGSPASTQARGQESCWFRRATPIGKFTAKCRKPWQTTRSSRKCRQTE